MSGGTEIWVSRNSMEFQGIPPVHGIPREVVWGCKVLLVDWDGISALPIVGYEDRNIAVGAPRPPIPDWDDVHERASRKIFDIRVGHTFADSGNRRGAFSSLNFGFSYGVGHKRPGNRKHTNPQHTAIIETLRADADIKILAAAASGECTLADYINLTPFLDAFAGWAPDLFREYGVYRQRLLDNDPVLQVNFERSVWSAATVNFGPQTMCVPHLDSMNLACGWCAIIALGNYNPDQGGHLILWDLGLVIRFPPGSILLIPSALIYHSNVAIQDGESRCSFTQYTAGGLFRWVDQGFQSQGSVARTCRIGPGIFSKISTILPNVQTLLF